MGRSHDIEPFLGVDLVGAEGCPDLVIEDLGRRSGQGAESGSLEIREEIGNRDAERLRTLPDLKR
jgi:hypothetical protein